MYQFDFLPVIGAFDQLVFGAWLTIKLSVGAMMIGLALSIVFAWAKTSGPKPLVWAIDAYIEIIRNTPFLVQIFFIFFGLPALGLRLTPNSAALLALVVNFGAYGTEIIRSGIESIHKGQIEAGTALGLTRLQVFRLIVLKPALRAIFPALTSQFIYLMLTSSVVSVISADDLAAAGNNIQSQTFASFEVYFVITAIYLAMSLAFSLLFSLVDKRYFAYPINR
ncbi:ABC transporter permease subunit [Stappia sp. GBMRC 2046]|uniref:ABC transporter permease subunit n=1 Tax=Stappia sediminis TaxID=2692190 RepID=A0A7X3S636_9HYPH|nr:amino acid ABC transporter permease [Stappia sediminis]MXN63646.1 ABC transporter permease subunit [Stappia sediminis]